MRKRGPYFNYVHNKQSGATVKIPRQTAWNRRNRENHPRQCHQQRQLNSESTSNTNMDVSIVGADDSQIQNNSMNEVDQTFSSDDDAIQNEEISFIGNDSDLNFSNSFVNDTSGNLDETEIGTNYDGNEDDDDISVDFFCKIHNSLECTVADGLSMVYAYSVRHNLSWTAVEDLILLVNSIIGNDSLPSSKYMFMKKFKPKKSFSSSTHFWCQVCEKYLGVKEDFVDAVCPNCNCEIVTDTKYKKNHFVTMPIKSQLKNVLEQNSEQLIYDTNSSSDIRDVHDSQNFRRLKSEMRNTPYITLTTYTDGASVFKSTKEKSLWPICVFVNEIDLEHRFKRKNILCTALTFGKTPNMSMFFKPLIEEIRSINADGGIKYRDKSGQYKIVKVIPMLFTADALAKAYVLNLTQHNGRFGCPYCLHRGTNIEGSTQIRYCVECQNARLRTNAKAREDMVAAHTTAQNVNGYKGLSPLLAFGQNFDIIWQVVIDKMHNVDMGVTKKLFDLFLNPKHRNERYNLFIEYKYIH